MSGRILAYVTCTRVKWECQGHVDDDATLTSGAGVGETTYCDGGCVDYPIEEHGWVDVYYSPRYLDESRNDVRPLVSEWEENREELQAEITSALEWLEGGYEDNGDGTFYARESYSPMDEPWRYSYAIHFTRKFLGPNGFAEEKWHPVKDGGFKI